MMSAFTKNTLLSFIMITSMVSQAWAQEPPKVKMTTEIPEGIETPDKIQTTIGTIAILKF